MKKIFPIIILIIGIGVAVGVFLFMKGRNTSKEEVQDSDMEETVPEILFDKRPVLSLTPSEDGHWLKLKIEKILIDAATLDYELTYKVPDGRTQGVPGTVKLTTKEDIEKDLLLGSESSGKFRYDEGVENGNVVLRFRNDKGKLAAKFETQFTLQSGSTEIVTPAGAYTLDKLNKGVFYISMDTVGYLGDYDGNVQKAFGIFSSSLKANSGSFESGNVLFYDSGKWIELNENKSSGVGFFILSS